MAVPYTFADTTLSGLNLNLAHLDADFAYLSGLISTDPQFNSIGVGTAASGVAGSIVTTNAVTVGTSVIFPSLTAQTDAAPGYGQTWQNVTASRAAGTTYTNTTTKPITVSIGLQSITNADQAVFSVNGVTVWIGQTNTPGGNYYAGISIIVPIGATYLLTFNTGPYGIDSWAELR